MIPSLHRHDTKKVSYGAGCIHGWFFFTLLISYHQNIKVVSLADIGWIKYPKGIYPHVHVETHGLTLILYSSSSVVYRNSSTFSHVCKVFI